MNKLTPIILHIALVAAAQADVVTGYFRSENRDEIFVSTPSQLGAALGAQQNSAGTLPAFALIARRNGVNSAAAIFRIEELPNGRQAWVLIQQQGNNILGVNANVEAVYEGQFVRGRESAQLILKPTSYARQIDCGSEDIKAELKGGWSWGANLNYDPRYRDDANNEFQIAGSAAEGSYQVHGTRYKASFVLTALFPGLATLKAQSLNREAREGYSLERPIYAVVAQLAELKSDGRVRRNELLMIELKAGESSCRSWASQLKELR